MTPAPPNNCDGMESAAAAAHQPVAEDVHQTIVRAKQDWECTADSLSHVVCLIDERRRVVRVNRAIESWELGRVNDVAGRDIHDLLHPAGCHGRCTLRTRLEARDSRITADANALHRLLTILLDNQNRQGVSVHADSKPNADDSIQDVFIKNGGKTFKPISVEKEVFNFPFEAFAPTSDFTLVLVGKHGQVEWTLTKDELNRLR